HEGTVLTAFPAQRHRWHIPLDLRFTVLHPIWVEERIALGTRRFGRAEHPIPRVLDCFSKRILGVFIGNVLPNSMAFVPVDSSLSLFKIHGVGGEIPMDDSVTVRMEVETFLTHRGACKDKRPERRVEAFSYCGFTFRCAFI